MNIDLDKFEELTYNIIKLNKIMKNNKYIQDSFNIIISNIKSEKLNEMMKVVDESIKGVDRYEDIDTPYLLEQLNISTYEYNQITKIYIMVSRCDDILNEFKIIKSKYELYNNIFNKYYKKLSIDDSQINEFQNVYMKLKTVNIQVEIRNALQTYFKDNNYKVFDNYFRNLLRYYFEFQSSNINKQVLRLKYSNGYYNQLKEKIELLDDNKQKIVYDCLKIHNVDINDLISLNDNSDLIIKLQCKLSYYLYFIHTFSYKYKLEKQFKNNTIIVNNRTYTVKELFKNISFIIDIIFSNDKLIVKYDSKIFEYDDLIDNITIFKLLNDFVM